VGDGRRLRALLLVSVSWRLLSNRRLSTRCRRTDTSAVTAPPLNFYCGPAEGRVKLRTGCRKHNSEATASSKRELIDTGTDKRHLRRNPKGQFKESDDVGRSLSADAGSVRRGQRNGARATRATGRRPPRYRPERLLTVSELTARSSANPSCRTARIAPLRQIQCFALIPRWVKNASMAVNAFSYCARVKGKCPAPGTVTSSSTTPALFSA
jgi:hypothetical protein